MGYRRLTKQEIKGMIGRPIHVRWLEDQGVNRPVLAREGYALIVDQFSAIACDENGNRTLMFGHYGITWHARRLAREDVG